MKSSFGFLVILSYLHCLLPVLFLINSCQPQGKLVPERPNIIFLLTDDQRDNTFNAMGHPWVKSPHIDRLMGESINMFFDSLPGNQPFCLSVSFNVPHGSQTTSMYTDCENWHSMMTPANKNPKFIGHPTYDVLYRGTPFDIPDDCAGDPYSFIPRHVMDQDKGRSKTYEYDYHPISAREHHIRYYQTITGLDNVIGGLIRKLEKRGLKRKNCYHLCKRSRFTDG